MELKRVFSQSYTKYEYLSNESNQKNVKFKVYKIIITYTYNSQYASGIVNYR